MSQIGRYNIVRKTGSHGIAALYEAFDPIMKRSVNICLAENPTDPDAAAEGGGAPVLVDSRRVSSLEHPNIVKVLAWDEDQDRPYMVMEQFEGRPLSELLAERSTLPVEEVAGILKHAAAGLDHAHSNGLIHRNLTAASLLVGEDGELKIAGFEMARQQGADQVLENPEALIGSIAYLAPEFLTGDAIDPRSDQFSLAVIAFEALTGQLPFHAAGPAARLKQVAFGSPEMDAAANLPAATVRVLEKGLSKTPAARYSSCGEYAAAFEASIVAKAPSAPTRIATPMPGSESSRAYVEAAPAPSGPSRATLLIAIAVAAVLAVAGVVYLMSPSTPPPAASKGQPAVTKPGPATAPGKTPAVAAPKVPAKAAPVTAKPAPKTDQPPPVVAKKKAAPKAAPPPPEPEPEPKAAPKFRPVEPKVVQP